MNTNAIVTAYYTGTICANGHKPTINFTCAAPRSIPFGTHIFIPTIGWRIVEDRTAKKYDGRIDVFMGSKKDCITFGKQKLQVTIYENLK